MKETSTDEQTKRNKKRRTLIQQAISKQASALKLTRDVYKHARSDVSNYESKFVCKHEITRLGARALVEEHW
jgi:hypothetical protein